MSKHGQIVNGRPDQNNAGGGKVCVRSTRGSGYAVVAVVAGWKDGYEVSARLNEGGRGGRAVEWGRLLH